MVILPSWFRSSCANSSAIPPCLRVERFGRFLENIGNSRAGRGRPPLSLELCEVWRWGL